MWVVWGGVAAVAQDRPLPKLHAGGEQRTLDTTPFAKVFETPSPIESSMIFLWLGGGVVCPTFGFSYIYLKVGTPTPLLPEAKLMFFRKVESGLSITTPPQTLREWHQKLATNPETNRFWSGFAKNFRPGEGQICYT